MLFIAVQQTFPGPLRVPGTEHRGRTDVLGKRLVPRHSPSRWEADPHPGFGSDSSSSESWPSHVLWEQRWENDVTSF